METQETSAKTQRSQKHPAGADSSQKEPFSTGSSQEKSQDRVAINLTHRLADCLKDVIVTNLDESFRDKYLATLGVKNGSGAGEKIEELIVKFKDNEKQKAIKGNSEKINENSP